jgi:hypothetical protein
MLKIPDISECVIWLWHRSGKMTDIKIFCEISLTEYVVCKGDYTAIPSKYASLL